jgi:hypothetical protein
MKTLLLLLASLVAFGQDLTNEIYWASQPHSVQAMKSLPAGSPERSAKAEALAKEGYRIDVPIMVFGWDAFKVMKLRLDYGYTWVPSALMPNIQVAPGLTFYGGMPYDPDAPPSGAIKVSTDARDYPPFEKPEEKKLEESPVGPQSIGSIYLTTPGDKYPAETIINEPRGKFVKRVKASPFGASAYWEKVQ